MFKHTMFSFPKNCPPQILLGTFLNILFYIMVYNNNNTEMHVLEYWLISLRGQFKSLKSQRKTLDP